MGAKRVIQGAGRGTVPVHVVEQVADAALEKSLGHDNTRTQLPSRDPPLTSRSA